MSLKLAPSDYEIYIPIGEWIEGNIKEWLFEQRPLFKKISAPIDTVLNSLDTLFNFIPFPIILLIFVIFAYKTNGIKFAIFSFLSLEIKMLNENLKSYQSNLEPTRNMKETFITTLLKIAELSRL